VKVDAFAPGGDVNSDGVFQPGDTIRYTVTIANTGDVNLIGVTFADATRRFQIQAWPMKSVLNRRPT